ncbi:hypothetical protein TP47_07130 [Xanthomonas citri pv. aurantifolii]|nr:hypothetical protein TP37_05195 [Xanthomonas citri pv. aurantifolii]TBW98938.1 hypothetical protein TP47_07130 [Xanthomonas citri pv. aurantifolii]
MEGRDIVHGVLPPGWERVVAVAILVTDLTVWTVDNQLRLLVASDLPPCIDCFLLGVMDRSCPPIAFAFDCPAILVGHYMLVLACHCLVPFA